MPKIGSKMAALGPKTVVTPLQQDSCFVPESRHRVRALNKRRAVSGRQRGVSCRLGRDQPVGPGYFVSGQPLSLADGNALSPFTTASCL